jgi:Uma2 family endonuclease
MTIAGISAMVSTQPPKLQAPIVTWEILPDTYTLPDDPVENIQQPRLSAGLLDALGCNDRIPAHSLIASNFALVATINGKTVVKAPDWLYVPEINERERSNTSIRRSYTPWAEGGPVAIVMEFLSEDDNGELSDRRSPPYGKRYFYEQILKVPTYVIFDPANAELEVYQLQNNRYKLTPLNGEGRVWIPELELFLGVWSGDRERTYAHWLRWWDLEGNLLLWGSEQADLERVRAEQERIRADEEQVRADEERVRADEERVRANEEQVRANEERVRAEAEAQRANQAEEERDRLAAKLREMGIDLS